MLEPTLSYTGRLARVVDLTRGYLRLSARFGCITEVAARITDSKLQIAQTGTAKMIGISETDADA
jgi:hypothetical protein